MPMPPAGSPTVFSIWDRVRSSHSTCDADCTFGSMIASRLAPAPSTTSTTSRYVHGVVRSLTRTTRVRPAQSPSFRAATTFLRASGLASGATASSRSRKTWSAGRPWALPSILTLDPGTARQDRRGRPSAAMVERLLSDR